MNRHPWIFSGAVQSLPDFVDGELLPIASADGEVLASAYFNRKSSIIGRVVAWGEHDPFEALRERTSAAVTLRARLIDGAATNALRVLNGEGDGVPGLVADLYADVLVLQVGTLGIEKLKPFLIERLCELLNPRVVLERSFGSSRKEEGLVDFQGVLRGEACASVEVRENGHQFLISFEHAQKTGFFLDQRDMRALVGSLAKDRTVLNCFSYTGGFSVYAAHGGAKSTTSIDSSKDAIALARKNLELNRLEAGRNDCIVADVFEYLRSVDDGADLIILDPPAFAKKKNHVAQAAKGYNDINRLAFEKILPGGIVVTCSCSHYVTEDLFRKIIFSAAREARREVKIIHKHRQAFDHPVSVYHPEGEYLKGFVLQVE